MLSEMRKVTRGWLGGGLLLLIAGSFAVFGINSNQIQAIGAADQLARGRGVTVSERDLQNEFDQDLERAQQQNPELTRAIALEQGRPRQLLQQMINERSIDALAKRLGLTTSDGEIARTIRGQQEFKNPISGAFDSELYARLLAENRLTTAQYEARLRTDLTRAQIASAAVAGAMAPNAFAKVFFDLQTEQRIVTVVEINPSLVKPPLPPNAEQLQAFYKENAARFIDPERRSLTLVFARTSDFLAKVSVDEAKIGELFEFRKPSLTSPEKRSYVQISAKTKEAAQEAARRLAAGESADAAAAAVGGQALTVTDVTREQAPDAAVAEAAFQRGIGETTAAIQGKLAWASARITGITPGVSPSLEAMRESLRTELAKEEAESLVSSAVQAFEEARNGGESLEIAAQQNGLFITKVEKIAADGRSFDGAEPLVKENALLKTAFATAEGEFTDFDTVEGGYALARVDAVHPSAPIPLEQIRAQLVLAWQAKQVSDAMTALAAKLQADVAAGKDFAKAASAIGAPIVAKSQPVTRSQLAQGPAAGLGNAIFAGLEGVVVQAALGQGQALALAQIESIIKQDPSAAPELLAQAKQAANQQLLQDSLYALQTEAARAADVKINETLFSAGFAAEAGEAEPEAKP